MPEETISAPDIFEKLFGKKPETGYIFTHIRVSVGWRAIIISWGAQGVGFGETTIFMDKKKINIDTECMGKVFCDAVVAEAVKQMKEKEDSRKSKKRKGSLDINSDFLNYMYNNVTWDKKGNNSP